MEEFRLRIGNVVIALLFETMRDLRVLKRYFDRESSSLASDLSLSIRFRDDASRGAVVPNSLFATKQCDGDGFSTAGGLIEGRFSARSGEGELTVQRLLARGGYMRIFEQIFYQAYWSAVFRKGADSFLLHSSGALRAGYGYAFTGSSGSGKSTVAQLSRKKAAVLNDEMTVIDLSSSPTLLDTPFNGFFKGKREGSAPLFGIFLLMKAGLHRVVRTADAESVKTLSREIVPPMGLETPASASLYMGMLELAQRTKESIPLFAMEFLPDAYFWDTIDALPRGSCSE